VKIGKPIVGVSINYRLSLWGFTSSNEMAKEGALNIGLRDQRLAMRWVQENIRAFGGDRKKVTIFGESAGAASVGFHLTAYGGRDDGLFRAAILQSGNPIFYSPQGSPNQTQAAFNTVASKVGCGNATNKVQCLREVPFQTLNGTMNGTLSTTGGFNPVIDGDFTQDYGSRALANGKFVKVPIIVGTNSDEGASFSPYGINTTSQFKAALSTLPPPYQDTILRLYPDDLSTNVIAALGPNRPAATFGQQFRRVATYTGDQLFIAPRRQTATTWAQHGLPAYAYRFNADQSGFAPELAVSHFKEIGFMFRNIEGVGFRPDIRPFANKPQRYIDLAEFMSSTWASFVYDLDPNGWKGRNGSVGEWPRYEVGDPRDFVFEANGTSHAEMDTWRKEGMEWINGHAADVYGR
jgi:carboxylesterase type B